MDRVPEQSRAGGAAAIGDQHDGFQARARVKRIAMRHRLWMRVVGIAMRHRLLVRVIVASALFVSLRTAYAKPEWAKPYLDLPTPQGPYIARNDAWVIV